MTEQVSADIKEDGATKSAPSIPPPPIVADIGEVLRWLATVTARAGQPIAVEVASAKWMTVSLPSTNVLNSWMTIIGAEEIESKNDDLGVWTTAKSVQIGRWNVALHCHVPPICHVPVDLRNIKWTTRVESDQS